MAATDGYLRQAPGSANDGWLRSNADKYGPLVPETPTGLTQTTASSTQRDLVWTAPYSGGSAITGYKIERESGVGGGWTTIAADTGSATTTYSDTTAFLGELNYRVSAINAIGTGPTSIPSDIPVKDGLLFDLHADVISQSDSTALASWSDRSGNGNNATGGTGATFRNTGGLKYVTFNGSTHYFEIPPYLAEIKTLFFVGRVDNVSSKHTLIGARALDTYSETDAYAFGTRADASHATERGVHLNALASVPELRASGRTAPTATWFLQTGIINGLTVSVRDDGAIVASDTVTDVVKLNVDGPIVVGAGYASGVLADWWDGDVVRIMGFSRVLTGVEITAVEEYLAAEHAIGLETDLEASFAGTVSGFTIYLTDTSSTPAGTTITSWAWDFDDGFKTSTAKNPTFIASGSGTVNVTLTVTNSEGNSETITQTYTFGSGSSLPPYDLPTTKAAGAFLIKLDSTVSYSGVTGVVTDTAGGQWLNYIKIPKSGGGTECRVLGWEITFAADQPVKTLKARLILNGAAGSISSSAFDSYPNNCGGSFAPVIFAGREILVQEPLASESSTDPDDWKPIFHGYIDDHPANYSGVIEVFARDVVQRLQIPYLGEATRIGTEGEALTLPEAIQLVLDTTTRSGLWSLEWDVDLEWAVESFLIADIDDILAYINEMARQRGGVVKWAYDATTERFQLTLYVEQVDKETPDVTYGPDETKDVPQHGSDITNVRNNFIFQYLNSAGTLQTITRGPTTSEIDAYGLKTIVIGTDQTAHIKDDDAANTMLDYIEDALRLPATVGARVISPRNTDIDVNTLIRFEADTRLSTDDVDLYVTGGTHRFEVSGEGTVESSTTVSLRNQPAGQLRAWLRKISGLVPDSDLNKPEAHVLTTVQDGKLTCFVELMQKGLKIYGVRARTRGTLEAWSAWSAPTRSADTTDNDSRLLGLVDLAINQYEQDVTLTGNELSWIQFEMDVETYPKPIFICEVSGDVNVEPAIVNYSVDGLIVTLWTDDDALSVRLLKTAGTGAAFDERLDVVAQMAVFDLTADVPSGDTWTFNATAVNHLVADIGDPGELTSPATVIMVENDGEPWLSMTPTEPADASGIILFDDVEASEIEADYRFKIYAQWQTYPLDGGPGTYYPERDITSGLSPSPLATGLTTVAADYNWSTAYVREVASPTHQVVYQFRATIVNGSGAEVYDSGTYPYTISYGFIE